MSYIVDNLMEDEIFIYRARLHWIMLVPPVIIAPFSFIVLSSFLPYGYRVHTGIAIFIGVILTILYKTSLYISTEFAITNRRIIVKTGIIRNDSFEIMLQKIEGIKVTQGIIGRLLDYGSIVVTGTGGSKEPVPRMAIKYSCLQTDNVTLFQLC